MSNPIVKYLRNMFAARRVLGDNGHLRGMARADALLVDLTNQKKVPGMAVTISRENEVLLQRGYGYADVARKKGVDPKKTQFRIASISKCITGLALGKMMEEGMVDLDASLYRYVPYCPKKRWDFTLRQLAGHTAGIRGYRGKEYALNEGWSIREGIQAFQDDPLEFEPGTGYLYNSFDFVLLSLAMQEASGVPFGEYVQEKVLEPLGMYHTIPDSGAVINQNEMVAGRLVLSGAEASHNIMVAERSRSYTKRKSGFKNAIPVHNGFKLAGGGYVSTSKDIARMGRAILNGDLLKPETYAELFRPQRIHGESTYYGLGFQVSEDAQGRHFVGHVGNSVGAYSNFFVYPQEKVVVSILINCTDPKVQQALNQSIETLFTDRQD
ncbi:MAG: serine hydrolase domain-containing protein [Flavobacteriaceae bacterium]